MSKKNHSPYVRAARIGESSIQHWGRSTEELKRREALAYDTAQFVATIVAASQKRLAKVEKDIKRAKHSR